MGRPRRNNADWFHHRHSEPETERQIAHLKLLYGGDGYMFYYCVLEYLTKQPRYRLLLDELAKSHLILHVGLEKNLFEKILQTAIEIGAFQIKDNVLRSDWLIKDLKPLEIKRKQEQARYKARHISATETKQKSAETKQKSTETRQNAAETHIVEKSREEKSREEKSKEKSREDEEQSTIGGEKILRPNNVLETYSVFEGVVKIFGQDGLELTKERRKNLEAALRLFLPNKILDAAQNLAATNAFKYQDDRHFDYLFDYFKYVDRIDFWANGGPPKNGKHKRLKVDVNEQERTTELTTL